MPSPPNKPPPGKPGSDPFAQTDPAQRDDETAGATERRTIERDGGDNTGERDLIAAVVYYNGRRQLFGRAAEPPRLGKYILKGVLGSGAMGTVLLGFNPDTEGEVAIKVVRPSGLRQPEQDAARLRREAQALAKLAHPNIIPIYDTGVADGVHFIVMRQSGGPTLRDAQAGKPWRSIIDLYVAAGRGLAAVHAKGLIHRDFKADNVLIGDDGQVMLADFGLVCLASPPDVSNQDPSAATAHPGALGDRLTATGAEAPGTPIYRAPEGLAGHSSPQSDLFSMAAALFEALYGILPFEGDTRLAYFYSTQEGKTRPAPPESTVPQWIHSVLDRALHPDPRSRQPGVKALIAALDYRSRERAAEDVRARKRRRKRFAMSITTASFAGLAIGLFFIQPQDRCAAPEAKIADIWHEQRAELQLAVDSLDSENASSKWDRINGLLDAYTALWATTYGNICRATYDTAASQSEELFDARVACLDQRSRELSALVAGFKAPSEENLDLALIAAAQLDSPAGCATASRTPSPTVSQKVRLLPIRYGLALARVHELKSNYPAADAVATEAVRAARDIDFAPGLAEALLTQGRTKWLIHDGEGARLALSEALDLAEANVLEDTILDANNLLIKVSALELHDAVRGELWVRQTRRELSRRQADDWRHSEFLNNIGLFEFHINGDGDAAAVLHRDALASRSKLPGETRLLVASSHQNLGNALAAVGNLDEAFYHYRESQRLNREVLGDRHQRVADDLYNEAASLFEAARYSEAEDLAEQALNGYLRQPGTASTDIADAHLLLAVILEAQHQISAGLAHARAASHYLANDPTASPGDRATAFQRIGSLERESLDWPAALRSFDRALTLLGSDASALVDINVSILVNRAITLTNQGSFPEAHHDCARALALAPPDEPTLARYRAAALRTQGRAFIHEKRYERAGEPLEEALRLLQDHADPPSLAEVQFLLAQTLAATKGDNSRADTLARRSLAFYRAAGHDEFIQDITNFLDHALTRSTP